MVLRRTALSTAEDSGESPDVQQLGGISFNRPTPAFGPTSEPAGHFRDAAPDSTNAIR